MTSESLSRYESVNAARIADYWHRFGHLWVKTWVGSDGYCRSNMRFISGGRGPLERKLAMHPDVRKD